MLIASTNDHASRLAAFGIGDADIAALRRQRTRVLTRLPLLHDQIDWATTQGTQLPAVLLDETLRRHRDEYWQCFASGELGVRFAEVATGLARAAFAKGVPSRSFTIRHSSAARIMIDGLFGSTGFPPGTPWITRVIRRRSAMRERAEFGGALQKALWLGLSILLEVYARVEAEEKSLAMGLIEQSFAERIAGIADVLASQVVTLDGAVISVSASAEQHTSSAEVLADDARQASQAVRAVSDSTDGLAQSVRIAGERIAQCARSAVDAADLAKLGDDAVAQFADRTAVIDQITRLINQLAERTKLLALNATIEAARAGLAGRGFAVVATEVTALARETSSAVKGVMEQVHLIRASARESATAIHALAGKIEEVSSIISMIAGSVVEQGRVTQDIAHAVKQAALGNEQVSQLMTTMEGEANRCLDLAGVLGTAAAGIGLQGHVVRDITHAFMTDVQQAQNVRGLSRPMVEAMLDKYR